METSVPNLRRHLAGLLGGVIDLGDFQRWYWANYTAIEQGDSDEDVDVLLLVLNRLSEYTGGHIDAAQLLDALGADPLVQHALQSEPIAVA